MDQWMAEAGIDMDTIHMHRPSIHDEQHSHYVVWVRDPIERFRSAFDYFKAVRN